ncbi:hypothetical protein KL911_005211 [Ogataea haglerorum]|uniref:uncharacterized protein n=1 Tax=Ogataea haglerorum TaxID=1937702 RepID=UPI001C89EBF3|nr:uncharacterized protein KL911_005211 [Ogataea haglerorum]KAG7749126.1 hypothetical protein KL911_005211 [Ogataea haglerorum]KAG7753671.1 hypothetical protein KL947_005203 [Ogataea haglerorum]KAG7783547.1 hypothetical protein KL945_005051 [Ogataea haglerorum]KAG7784282.1 hypothetical protein KL910_005210 [Ogataea haglerorum]
MVLIKSLPQLVLLYAVINKMCGVYGLLSFLTGHPIDAVQWVYYLSSTAVMVLYIQGFRRVQTPNINWFSLVVFVYLLDTVIGFLYTGYFSWLWFSEHDNYVQLTARAVTEDLSSQSASGAYELFVTVALTVITSLVRLYFTAIMLAFFKEMRTAAKFDARFRISSASASSSAVRWLNKAQHQSYSLLNRIV